MSITELRLTPDKSGKDAVVCDVAIHPQFFRKVEAVIIFRDFLVTIIFEALDAKYNIQINRDTWIILKNRKSLGTLEKHRIQNRDVQKVYESYQNPSKDHKTLINELKSDGINATSKPRKNLITEIDPKTAKSIGKGKNLQPTVNSANKTPIISATKSKPVDTNRKLEYRLFKTKSNSDTAASLAVAEFFLPEVMSIDELTLDLGRDRLVLEARRAGYLHDSFFPFEINVDLAQAEFDKTKHVSKTFWNHFYSQSILIVWIHSIHY